VSLRVPMSMWAFACALSYFRTHTQDPPSFMLQVVIFNRGRIEQQGSPNDIIKNPRTPFIMKFVGDTNIVPATSQVSFVWVMWVGGCGCGG